MDRTAEVRKWGDMRKLIVGNWKMNGGLSALDEVSAIDRIARDYPALDVGLALPATLINPAITRATTLMIGAQDIHAMPAGAYTGSVSAQMVREVGAVMTIVGHSERRQMQGETSADVRAKALAGTAAGLQVILCVGEMLHTRMAGEAEAYVARQLAESLPADAAPASLSIAYEPIWAIGTGKVASVADVATMHAALRKTLRTTLGAKAGEVRLLYGGSVTAQNARGLLATPNVDGALVGGASLTAADFGPIIVIAAELTAHIPA